MDWEFGVNRCKLLPLEWISKELIWKNMAPKYLKIRRTAMLNQNFTDCHIALGIIFSTYDGA